MQSLGIARPQNAISDHIHFFNCITWDLEPPLGHDPMQLLGNQLIVVIWVIFNRAISQFGFQI